MLKIIKYITFLVALLIPRIKRCAFFCSFEGMYNDNPKAISEKLHEAAPNFPIYWAISNKCNEKLPNYIHVVKYGSIRCWYLAACSKVVVDNYIGMRSFAAKAGSIKNKFQILLCRKRKDQLCISTWHGTPLKKIGFHVLPNHIQIKMTNYTCTDYVVAGCEYTKNCFNEAYKYCVPVRMYGTPRNDILFNGNIDKFHLKKKLGLPHDKKIVLFAPTFRDNVAMSGVFQMQSINFSELFNALKNRFGGEWIFVVRVHHEVMKQINTDKLSLKYGKNRIADGNIGDDMAEYLICTDILITDYSGSMFDFALIGKPCFLFSPDLEHYKNIERGFYMNYGNLPFPVADNSNELVNNIINYDAEQYKNNVKEFIDHIENIEDGYASQRIVNDILHFIKTGKK